MNKTNFGFINQINNCRLSWEIKYLFITQIRDYCKIFNIKLLVSKMYIRIYLKSNKERKLNPRREDICCVSIFSWVQTLFFLVLGYGNQYDNEFEINKNN